MSYTVVSGSPRECVHYLSRAPEESEPYKKYHMTFIPGIKDTIGSWLIVNSGFGKDELHISDKYLGIRVCTLAVLNHKYRELGNTDEFMTYMREYVMETINKFG